MVGGRWWIGLDDVWSFDFPKRRELAGDMTKTAETDVQTLRLTHSNKTEHVPNDRETRTSESSRVERVMRAK